MAFGFWKLWDLAALQLDLSSPATFFVGQEDDVNMFVVGQEDEANMFVVGQADDAGMFVVGQEDDLSVLC